MDESRKSFEQWASKQFNISVEEIVNKRMLGDYLHNPDLHNAWQAWIDSRAAIEIELPKPHAHLIWIQAGHAPDDYWIEFILEQIRKMREKNQPDMMEIWRRQQEEYRKHIFGERKQDDWSLYGYGTRTNKNGYSLYTY